MAWARSRSSSESNHSQASASHLHRLAGKTHAGRHVEIAHAQVDTYAVAYIHTVGGVAHRLLAPQMKIAVGCHTIVALGHKRLQQSHRIGPAAERHNHVATRLQQAVAAYAVGHHGLKHCRLAFVHTTKLVNYQ